MPNELAAARDLMAFIDAAPTPYHCVAEVARRLRGSGFGELLEGERWELAAGQRFFVVRGGSIAAFVVGGEPPHAAGFRLVGAHTDSPNLRVKPSPDVRAHGYHQLALEPYGGLLYTTWLDRDLSLAGRVVLDDGSPRGRAALIDFARPLLRIPNLAIHLNRTVNTDGLKLNAQTHLVPVLGLCEPEPDPDFVELLAQEVSASLGAKIEARAIVGYDLCAYDTQKAVLGGPKQELIFAARLDNQASCHAATHALCGVRAERAETRGIVLYDHEEVGSRSAQGASSTFLGEVLERIADARGDGGRDVLARAVTRSLLLSTDMAHGVHPSYADKHEPGHKPVLGKGPVLKTNVSMSYASDAETSAAFRLVCQRAGVTPQHFVSRADLTCGSTIGPITASRVGLPTVDVGNPLLSMHSVREMAATADVAAMLRVLEAFFG